MLPDGKTVVGPDGSTAKKLMMEDISLKKVTQLGTHKNWINTVLYDEATNSLFAGDGNGHVLQYKKEDESSSFTLFKDHGHLGIDHVCSSGKLGRFAFFGGQKDSIKVIDMDRNELLEGSVKTGFGRVLSLRVCRMEEIKKVLLSVGGRFPSFSGDNTDIFELQGKFFGDDTKKKMVSDSQCMKTLSKPIEPPQAISCQCESQKVLDTFFRTMHRYFGSLLRYVMSIQNGKKESNQKGTQSMLCLITR